MPLAALLPVVAGAAGSLGAGALGSAISKATTPQSNLPLGGINQEDVKGTLSQEQQLAQALQEQMQGKGPNLAETQLRAATDLANQQTAGLISGQRGINPGLAARQILSQRAQTTQAAANQAAQLRQMQQLMSQQQLGGVLGQMGAQQAGQQQLALQQSLGNLGVQAPAAAGISSGLAPGIGKAIGSFFHEGGEVDMTDGGHVPGRATLEGDHPDNDTVPAMLSPGEIVIPRSAADSPDKAAEFVAALQGSPKGYGKVLKAKQKLAMYRGGRV